MTSLGSTPRLRTNSRLLLMRDKAFQEEQRKRQKMMGSPRSLNPSSRNHPPLNNSLVVTNNGLNSNLSTTTIATNSSNSNNEALNGILSHSGNVITNGLEPNHHQLDLMQHGEDFGGIYDSPISPYSLTPSSMTTSISEYDAIFEDFNEIVEKEGQQQLQQSSTFSNYNEKITKSEGGGKNTLKTSSSYPTMKSSRLTLPSKLDPSDFPDIDSYKKEKHNIVEKKRRYKINDCIQELADLLPDSYDVDLNMKKGYILEKSVEYIHELKKDHDKKAELERRHKELEREHRQMQLELQALKRSLQQQQQQQQQQFLIVSPTFQQPQQHHISPQPSQIFLSVNDNNFSAVDQSMNNIINPSVFINDYGDSDVMTQDVSTINNNNKSLVDTDFLLSNLQLTKELTGNDRQELNNFVNLDDFVNDDVMMTDFVFPNATDQF